MYASPRRGRRKRAAPLVAGLCLVALGCTLLAAPGPELAGAVESEASAAAGGGGRRLLQTEGGAVEDAFLGNCTPRSIEQFPRDIMSLSQRQRGGVLFHVLVAIYTFCALAIVCDDYFVSSLEYICDALGLQADVAGATFMAAGSSAPELFTSIIGVFLAKSDVGIGTIVGSAVFNILFIIAICGLGAGMVIYLTWWPMFRDCLYYMLSVIVLVVVIYDEQVHWYEALVMFLLYVLYIVIMYFNPVIGNYFIQKVDKMKETNSVIKRVSTYHANLRAAEDSEEKVLLLGNDKAVEASGSKRNVLENSGRSYGSSREEGASGSSGFEHSAGSEREIQEARARGGLVRSTSRVDSQSEAASVKDKDEEYESPLTVPDSLMGKIWWGLMLPVTLLFVVTIPDCRRPGGCWSRLYLATFTMSIVWIALLSYLMVWMVTVAGDTIGVPDTVMGLTVLAAGTSVPDALSSLFVARDGYGDMAVANSIGSNVFDILLCLGLPWLLQTTAVDTNSVVQINSASLTFVSITLLATVVFLFTSMLLNGWKLNKKFGVMCIVVYVIVITIACLFEMNVFGQINPPTCPRSPGFY